MSQSRPSTRSAFTLVEMLVVIAIITILAALITPAIFQAMWTARQSRIKVELDQLASGIEAFKAKYGSYPPANLTINSAGTNNPALLAFVAKVFPRYTYSSTLGAQIYSDFTAAGVDTAHCNPQAALVFWLSGFGPDVTDPFNRAGVAITRTPFFTFDQTRVLYSNTVLSGTSIGQVANLTTASGAGNLMYNAPYGNAAYAYFDSNSYGTLPNLPAQYNSNNGSTIGPLFATTTSNTTTLTGISVTTLISNGTGYVVPYVADLNANGQIDLGDSFAKPQSYQIISAGQDGAFGSSIAADGQWFRLFATGVGYDPAGTDADNVTNLTDKNNLDAAKP